MRELLLQRREPYELTRNTGAHDTEPTEMKRQHLQAFLTSLALVAAVMSAGAAEPASVQGAAPVQLDPSGVRSRAVAQGPGVRAARVGRSEARRVRDAADQVLSFPPRLEVDAALRSYPGGEGMDVGASVWQDFSLGGHGAARMAFADARTTLSAQEEGLALRDAVERALLAWVDARLGREILAIRSESAAAATQLERIAGDRVRAGKDAPIEASMAKSVLGAARAGVLQAHGRVVEADAALRYAVGLGAEVPVEVRGDIRSSDDRPIDEQAVVERALRRHPLVEILQGQAALSERAADIAASNGKPVLGVGLTYAREATGDRIVGGAVSVPIPLVNPQSFDVSNARADAAVLRARVGDVQMRVERDVRMVMHEREHAREVRDELRQGAVEPGAEALRELLVRYETGAADLATVLAARRELMHAQEAWLESAADVHRADLRLEHAIGGALPRRASR